MKDKFINECKQIQQNCTYTAEAHHHLAIWNRILAYVFQIIPAIVAALTSTLVIANVKPNSWLWATLIASVITAVSTILDPNKKYQDHLNAAKNFTILKHDARFLHEARFNILTDEAFCAVTENLHQRYNDLVRLTPPTGGIAFRKAREIIRTGIHVPDKDVKGKIK